MRYTFYATIDCDSLRSYLPAVPLMLPASSWYRVNFARPRIPSQITEVAADSGGFAASFRWGGEYKYSLQRYITWLDGWRPSWAATMDYCVKPANSGANDGLILQRQQQTTDNAWSVWRQAKYVPWVWVPTVQGWEPNEYRHHAQELRPLIQEMQHFYGPSSAFRVGVGSLCGRTSSAQITAILRAIREVLPTVPLHLWAVKLGAIKTLSLSGICSSDSAVWNGRFFQGRQIRQEALLAGMSMRKYLLLVKLPDYAQRIRRACTRNNPSSKQNTSSVSELRWLLRLYGWKLTIRTGLQNHQEGYAVKGRGRKREERHLAPLQDLPLPLIQIVSQLSSSQKIEHRTKRQRPCRGERMGRPMKITNLSCSKHGFEDEGC